MHEIHGAKAHTILASITPEGRTLRTIYARYPRMVHAEAKTHRRVKDWAGNLIEVMDDISLLADESLSRNGRSSRAVPVARLMEEARTNPYVPNFMANGKGMVPTEELNPDAKAEAERLWRFLAILTVEYVEALQKLGVHKQWANRPLEWFGYIDVLITATNWENFLALRDHPAAQQEMQDLAKCVSAELTVTPTLLRPGEWHLPYIRDEDHEAALRYICGGDVPLEMTQTLLVQKNSVLRKVSVARCARLTYEPFDGNGDIASEIKRHDLLVVQRPVHASPAEHQATPDTISSYTGPTRKPKWRNPHLHGNLTGFIQYRKMLPHECVGE